MKHRIDWHEYPVRLEDSTEILNNKAGHKKIIESLHREENYNKDSLIVKHHREKYENKMPLWVCVVGGAAESRRPEAIVQKNRPLVCYVCYLLKNP